MAETPNVCHQLHMPLQSGSDRVLKAMRRSYRSERYLGILDEVRAAMPDAAITTDIIVGFPGETEEDFQATLDVVAAGPVRQRVHLPVLQAPRHARRRRCPTRSPRRSCRSATSGWSRSQEEISWELNKELVGSTVEVLVADGRGPQGRGDAPDERSRPRRPAGALHADRSGDRRRVRPGDVVHADVTYGAPHHLVADGDLLSHRRTRAGDNGEAGLRPKTSGVEPRPAVLRRAGSLGTPVRGAVREQQRTQVRTLSVAQLREQVDEVERGVPRRSIPASAPW